MSDRELKASPEVFRSATRRTEEETRKRNAGNWICDEERRRTPAAATRRASWICDEEERRGTPAAATTGQKLRRWAGRANEGREAGEGKTPIAWEGDRGASHCAEEAEEFSGKPYPTRLRSTVRLQTGCVCKSGCPQTQTRPNAQSKRSHNLLLRLPYFLSSHVLPRCCHSIAAIARSPLPFEHRLTPLHLHKVFSASLRVFRVPSCRPLHLPPPLLPPYASSTSPFAALLCLFCLAVTSSSVVVTSPSAVLLVRLKP